MHRTVKRNKTRRGFTLVEVIIALVILGIGLVGVIQLFPMGLRSSARAESGTRAAILAQQIMEGLKADSHDLPIIPGDPNLYPIPGNGFDDDNRADCAITLPPMQRTSTQRQARHGLGRGYVDANGDRIPDGASHGWYQGSQPGWRSLYDPEFYGALGIDEEYADGKDNDGDGKIDEDTRLASNSLTSASIFPYDPLAPGDGIDNDGDGEEGSPTRRILVDTDGNPGTPPQWVTVKVADGEDNNGNGIIDEGIDEDIYGLGDNRDCRMACYPFTPKPFPPLVRAAAGIEQERFESPNENFSWQIFVGRVSDGGGDGLDNDGDGLIDEDPRDGIDNDLDGKIDEDPSPMPLPGFRKVTVRITWGGDYQNNDGDFNFDPKTGARVERIDEELRNGIDDDLDGRVDEDCFEYFYDLTGYIKVKTGQ
jgi:prepilin-type N-terminal cleavage/methylation domain-containing protein